MRTDWFFRTSSCEDWLGGLLFKKKRKKISPFFRKTRWLVRKIRAWKKLSLSLSLCLFVSLSLSLSLSLSYWWSSEDDCDRLGLSLFVWWSCPWFDPPPPLPQQTNPQGKAESGRSKTLRTGSQSCQIHVLVREKKNHRSARHTHQAYAKWPLSKTISGCLLGGIKLDSVRVVLHHPLVFLLENRSPGQRGSKSRSTWPTRPNFIALEEDTLEERSKHYQVWGLLLELSEKFNPNWLTNWTKIGMRESHERKRCGQPTWPGAGALFGV